MENWPTLSSERKCSRPSHRPPVECARDLAMQSLAGSIRHNIAIGQLDTELLFGSHFRKQDKLVANLVDGFYADLLGAL